MANQRLVRHVNERRLLTALRVGGPLPRAELARRLGLTRAAVTAMIDDLLARGLVRELPGGETGKREVGRPGIAIGLDPAGAAFFGVEIGVGLVRFALLDLCAQPIATETVAMAEETPEAVVALIAQRLAAQPVPAERIRALGITVPGLVRRDGSVINLPILGWRGIDLAPLVAGAIDLPWQIENNANAAAFGHIYADPREHGGVMAYLKLGTGCGGAVIAEDRLLRGTEGLGCEFGHIRIADDGPLCSCGQRGCLETFVNLKALERYATAQDVDAQRADLGLPARLAARMAQGDADAAAAVERLAGHLARGLTNITNMLNPGEIVLGGTMLPVLDAVAAHVAPLLARSIIPGMTVPRLTVSRLGPFECAIGAAALAHHEAFDLSNLDLRA